MRITRLWLSDFRNYTEVDFTPASEGLTVINGANAGGKTNLLEAIGYLALSSSFRGAPAESLVRHGAETAIIRSEAERQDRSLLIEAEIPLTGRGRMFVNRQPVRKARDLQDTLMVTVFSPEDLVLIKGSPGERRRYIDAVLSFADVRNKALQGDFDRVINQRNSLLRQAGGRLSTDIVSTLDVWDAKLTELGELVAQTREAFISDIESLVAKTYDQIAQTGANVTLKYERSWDGSLSDALLQSRDNDVRRGITTVGPHRDELGVFIDGLPGRTQASQGEQRSLALALRLSAHLYLKEVCGVAPILLLDDVFSELDPQRTDALLAHLPSGQSFLTTAGLVTSEARPECVIQVRDGKVFT